MKSDFIFASRSICLPFLIRTISQCHQRLSVFLDSMTGSAKGNADNLLPAMIQILLSAHPTDLWTLSRILDTWAPSLRIEGYEQYSVTTFVSHLFCAAARHAVKTGSLTNDQNSWRPSRTSSQLTFQVFIHPLFCKNFQSHSSLGPRDQLHKGPMAASVTSTMPIAVSTLSRTVPPFKARLDSLPSA